jgi:hypothetical protein
VFDDFFTSGRKFVPDRFYFPKIFVLGPVWMRHKPQFLENRSRDFAITSCMEKTQNVCNVRAVEIQKVI